MAIDNLLPSVVTVQRASRIPDGRGGFTKVFDDHHDEIVRIGQPNGRDVPVAMRKQGLVMSPVYGQPDADIRIGDRLTIDDDVYEVRVAKLGIRDVYSKCLAELYDVGA